MLLQMGRKKKSKNQKKGQKQLLFFDDTVLVEYLINDLRSFRADRVQGKLNFNVVHSST